MSVFMFLTFAHPLLLKLTKKATLRQKLITLNLQDKAFYDKIIVTNNGGT